MTDAEKFTKAGNRASKVLPTAMGEIIADEMYEAADYVANGGRVNPSRALCAEEILAMNMHRKDPPMDMPRVRYECPLDGCDWSMDEPPTGQITVMGVTPEAFSVGIGDARRKVLAQVDEQVSEHFKSHTPVDFLRTIQRLNQDLAAALATARSVAQSDQRQP